MLFAFLITSSNAIAAMKHKRLWWVHTLLQATTLSAVLYAYFAVWWMKEQFGKAHFWTPWNSMVSWHAIIGGITIVLWVHLQF
jgi:hypothetical protein